MEEATASSGLTANRPPAEQFTEQFPTHNVGMLCPAHVREQLEDQLCLLLDLKMIDFPQNLLYNVGRPEVVLAGL